MGRAASWAGLLLIVLVRLVLRVASTGTRFVLLRKPTASYLEHFLERLDMEGNDINHPYAGFTDPAAANGKSAAPPRPPPGFQERTMRVRLGSGRMTYARGREALLQWKMHDGSSWAGITLGRRLGGKQSLPNMATIAKSLGGLMWVINPCRVIYERMNVRLRLMAPPVSDEDITNSSNNWMNLWGLVHGGSNQEGLWAGKAPGTAPPWARFSPGEGHTGKQAAVAYATREGHLIQGEERMRVVWFCGRGGDDSVWFEVYSASTGAGRIGGLVFPLAQAMQAKFFREQAETIRRIVDE